MPFYDENGQCIGMASSIRYLEVYSPNDFVRGKLPGSLLLSKPDDFFTERECEIIFLKLQGISAKEIAKILMLSPRTIEHRIANLYVKANVNNFTEFCEFCEFCHQRDFHRYLPQRFLLNQKLGFAGDFYEDEETNSL